MGLPGPKILVGVAFALLVGAAIMAFFAGISVPFLNDMQGNVLGYFEQVLAVIDC